MASTYTSNSGVEKPGIGDQSGEWGTTVNTNMDILDRAINGVGVITLSGTTHTLTTTDGALSDGQYKVLVLSGSPSGTNTITISPNDQDKLYFVVNSSGQTATFSQGSGANVSVVNGDTKIIYADGAGSGAAVTEFASEVDALEGITAGTVSASKAVIVDANKDITGFRNVTLTGELDAGSLDVSGNADIDGTLEADAITLDGTSITTTATLSTGISNNNVPVFTTGVADDDFLRVAGTAIEGRSAAEVLSDIGGQASLTFGISNTNAVKIDSASVADDEYARFTANGLESRSTAEVLSDIGASPVAGSGSIVTTGALNSGSITSGFGSIDNGSSAITTTGVITGGTVEATTDTAAGDNAAIGYTSAEGLILTGQGSTSDFTVKNDADATVLSIPTGSGNVGIGTTAASTYANSMGNTLVVGTGNNFAVIQGRTDGASGSTNGVNYGGSYGTNPINGARMLIGAAGSAGQRGLVTFNTKNTDDNTNQPSEKMRIGADGKVGVGTTANLSGYVNLPESDYGEGFNWFSSGTAANRGGIGHYAYESRIYYGASDNLTFVDGGPSGTERMRIDSSGNVGIGTTTPDGNLHVHTSSAGTVTAATDANQLVLESTTNVGMSFLTGNASFVRIKFGDPDSNNAGHILYAHSDNSMRFRTSGSEAMRIHTNGGVSIGNTATPPAGGIILPNNGALRTNGGTIFSTSIAGSTTAAGANVFINSSNGAIQRSTSSIKYKTDIEDLDSNISSNIYEMRPVWYRSLGDMDKKDRSYYGLIAEEVGEIEPRLVHWAEKEDGTLEAEGVMYERLTVLLIAEIKKLKTELDAVKSELNTLKGN